jgi:hypothetical protein
MLCANAIDGVRARKDAGVPPKTHTDDDSATRHKPKLSDQSCPLETIFTTSLASFVDQAFSNGRTPSRLTKCQITGLLRISKTKSYESVHISQRRCASEYCNRLFVSKRKNTIDIGSGPSP